MTEKPVPGGRYWSVRPGTEHNLCRVCLEDFGSLESFDEHRSGYKISGETLRGTCKTPKSMGLIQNLNGTWHTKAMTDKVARMRA